MVPLVLRVVSAIWPCASPVAGVVVRTYPSSTCAGSVSMVVVTAASWLPVRAHMSRWVYGWNIMSLYEAPGNAGLQEVETEYCLADPINTGPQKQWNQARNPSKSWLSMLVYLLLGNASSCLLYTSPSPRD